MVHPISPPPASRRVLPGGRPPPPFPYYGKGGGDSMPLSGAKGGRWDGMESLGGIKPTNP